MRRTISIKRKKPFQTSLKQLEESKGEYTKLKICKGKIEIKLNNSPKYFKNLLIYNFTYLLN